MHSNLRPTLAVFSLAASLAALPAAGFAESHEEAPRPFIYGTYMECATGTQSQSDAIVKNVMAPVFDKGVEDGTIASWGWMGHAVGGKWRRVMYMIAPTLEGVIEANNALNSTAAEGNPLEANRFQQICPAHDDYIWRWVAGSADDGGEIAEQRAEVGMSTYWVCDMTNEARADEIITQVAGPVWQKQIDAGMLASWGWLEHVIGGEYRRASTLTAKDLPSLLAARQAVIAELFDKHADQMKELTEICHTHQDYVWNVMMETP